MGRKSGLLPEPACSGRWLLAPDPARRPLHAAGSENAPQRPKAPPRCFGLTQRPLQKSSTAWRPLSENSHRSVR